MESHDEQIPHLEPLTAPNSEVNSLRCPSPAAETTAPCIPVTPNRKPEPEHAVGWFTRDLTAPFRFNLVLENRGNVARDHLASERTYLAYMRTSLACASAGVAAVQLLLLKTTADATTPQNRVDLSRFARPLGGTVVLFGLLILVFGLVRYFQTQSALIRGQFPVARRSITVMAAGLGSLVVAVFAIIIVKTRG